MPLRPLVLSIVLTAALAGPAFAAPKAAPQTCAVQLKAAQSARDLTAVKLEEETERADAQFYLTRLELQVTKQRLAAALAKCGAACAPPAAAPARP